MAPAPRPSVAPPASPAPASPRPARPPAGGLLLRRAAAAALDLGWLGVLLLTLLDLGRTSRPEAAFVAPASVSWAATSAVLATLAVGAFVLATGRGRTPGRRLMGLRVVPGPAGWVSSLQALAHEGASKGLALLVLCGLRVDGLAPLALVAAAALALEALLALGPAPAATLHERLARTRVRRDAPRVAAARAAPSPLARP